MTRTRNLALAAWAVALCGGAVLGQSPSGDPLNKCGMGFQPVFSPAGSRCHTCSHRFETGATQRISPLQQAASGSDETVLGMSTALTGPAAQPGLNMRSGVLAALDDRYEPSCIAPNHDKLIEEHQVLAFVGDVGTPTAVAAIPITNAKKTVLLGAFAGTGVLDKVVPERGVVLPGGAAHRETEWGGFEHERWTIADGLPQNSVSAIVQTRDGYLWLGTFGGLARFDGVRFKIFDISNTKALTSNRILSLLEDRSGNLWIGTQGGGGVRSRDGVFTSYRDRENAPSGQVCSIVEDRDGVVWFGTSHLVSYAGGYGFPTITEAAKVVEESAKAGVELEMLAEQIRALAELCGRARASASTT